MTELLKTIVREDWRELTEEMHQRHLRRWRSLVGLVMISTLGVVVIQQWVPAGPPQKAALTSASSSLFISFFIYASGRQGGRQRALAAYVGLVVLAALGHITQPGPAAETGPLSSLAGLVGTVVMLGSWVILHWALQWDDDRAIELGVTDDGWPVNVTLGLLISAALAAHLTVVRACVRRGRHRAGSRLDGSGLAAILLPRREGAWGGAPLPGAGVPSAPSQPGEAEGAGHCTPDAP